MSSIDEQVIDFHYELFDHIFTEPFRPKIKDRLRRDAVARQVQEAAGAASQALTRFFNSERLPEERVRVILLGFRLIFEGIKSEDIDRQNQTPEALVDDLLQRYSSPRSVIKAGLEPVYRLALHQTVQVLMLVGPVMTEWQKLSFSSTFEMPRRIVTQLNQITEGLQALTSAGQDAADERYELSYRDHLLQRFYRVEAGTVRMTTNVNVDLRELFVMPRVTVRSPVTVDLGRRNVNSDALMNLAAARAIFDEDRTGKNVFGQNEDKTVPAIDQVRRSPRNVIIGVPGGGKSTLFEWLQLSLANVDAEVIAGAGQAIPLLLRVRQLDPQNLPSGPDLIEKATASRDRAALMPSGWIDRQMRAGRVLFMLDGLDETEPKVRDQFILPWLTSLCEKYPDCLYLVSSRPVGYPPGTLQKLKFAECDLQDFNDAQIIEYTRHWCTAIRIAQNDPDEEARREGAKEGDQIVNGFKSHPYIRNLARNPLMLSAICLVNYFEGGQLPKDRAVLYRLCVEGLLHHWDQRRGIHSEYSLDEKLRVCREVALAMHVNDKAEYEFAKVLQIMVHVLKNRDRAKNLLEHIRYRTGLLIERRAEVFAFAHLTFQEYLAARAIYEGNHLRIDANQLVTEHEDSRWKEVIALYCGLANAAAARKVIENLLKQPTTEWVSEVLAEAFLSSTSELVNDQSLRFNVLNRIAASPSRFYVHLNRFSIDEVSPIANALVGTVNIDFGLSESFAWLRDHRENLNAPAMMERLRNWKSLSPNQRSELFFLMHLHSPDNLLGELSARREIYKSRGPTFQGSFKYRSQAEVALMGLSARFTNLLLSQAPGAEQALLQALRVIAQGNEIAGHLYSPLRQIFGESSVLLKPVDARSWSEFAALTRNLAIQIVKGTAPHVEKTRTEKVLRDWATRLEEISKDGSA